MERSSSRCAFLAAKAFVRCHCEVDLLAPGVLGPQPIIGSPTYSVVSSWDASHVHQSDYARSFALTKIYKRTKATTPARRRAGRPLARGTAPPIPHERTRATPGLHERTQVPRSPHVIPRLDRGTHCWTLPTSRSPAFAEDDGVGGPHERTQAMDERHERTRETRFTSRSSACAEDDGGGAPGPLRPTVHITVAGTCGVCSTNEPEPRQECTNEPKTTHANTTKLARPAIAGGTLDGRIESGHDDWTVMRPSVLHERTRARSAARSARTNPRTACPVFSERTRAPQLKPVTTCGT